MAFDVEGARKAGYSDTEIADHLATEKKFDTQAARAAGYNDADIIRHLGSASWGDIAKDVGKQVLAAPVAAAENMVTWPAKVSNLLSEPAKYLGRKAEEIGLAQPDDGQAEQNRETLRALVNMEGGSGGTTQYLPEPETTAGKYTRTGVEAVLPAVLGLPGRAAQTAINAGIGLTSGLASEGAGQLAETYAPEHETAARIGTSLLTGGAGAIIPNKIARKTASELVPTAEKNLAAGDAKFEAVKTTGVTFDPTAVSRGLDDIKTTLRNEFGNNKIIKPVTALLGEQATASAPQSPGAMYALTGVKPTQRAPVEIGDLQNLRSQLGKMANGTDPALRHAAQTAQSEVDDFIGVLASNPRHVISGDAAAADALLREARRDWGAGRRGQTVEGRLELGELNAETSGSGRNVDNTGRQAVKSLLRPDMNGRSQATKRGFDEAEQAQMRRITAGNRIENALRTVGGAGLIPGVVMGAGVGGYYASDYNPAYLAAIPLAAGARHLSGTMTKNQERVLREMVNSRSPNAAQRYRVTQPPRRLSTGATGMLLGTHTATGRLGNPLLDDDEAE